MSLSQRKKPTDADDHRPLMFAQTSSAAASIAPSELTTASSRDFTRSFAASEATAAEDPQDKLPEQSFVRPQTPPQGSNYTAWSSYRDLPADHPVFRYPGKMREDMYAKGVGEFPALADQLAGWSVGGLTESTDPVVKAELDLARLGKVYGENHRGKSFWKRGTSMMGQFGTRATGGSF